MISAEQANNARVPRRGHDERAETLRHYRGLPEGALMAAYADWWARLEDLGRQADEARRHLATIADVQRERGG